MVNVEAETKQIKYAGFWKRLSAYLVDVIIINVVGWIFGFLGIFGIILALIFSIIYFVGFWAWLGQTPGKAAIGVKIVRLDGTPIGIRIAIHRFIGYVISFVTLCIGFLMIAFHENKRGLHDIIAGTMVVIVPSTLHDLKPREEFESSLAKIDDLQKTYHGF